MEKIKTTIKDLILSICCSFSVIVIANVFLVDETYAMTISAYELKQTFYICIITCVVVKLITTINFKKEWMSYVFSFMGMTISVFGLGTFVFHIIPLETVVYISVSIMLIIVYFLVVTMVYMIHRNEADAINEIITKRTKPYREEHHE